MGKGIVPIGADRDVTGRIDGEVRGAPTVHLIKGGRESGRPMGKVGRCGGGGGEDGRVSWWRYADRGGEE